MVRTALVTATSLALTGAVVSHAYLLKQQFYPTVVHLRNSSPSMAVLYLQALVLLYLVARVLRALFFGRLSAGETERLVERCGYAVTETCVAFTVFRDDLSARFVALFTLLLFLKCFHWLAEDRVDFMERSPAADPESVSWLFHLRVRSLLSLLAVLDFLFVRHACRSVASNGLSVQLVFGVEYAVLLTMALTTLAKYLLHSAELRRGPLAWEHKSVYMLYVELLTGTVTVLLHLAFVGVMLRALSFPLFATRPLYLATRRLRRALTDAVMSRRAVRQMNALYPDATAADLQGPSSDNVCAVCREEMVPGGGAKKLPCSHIFHMGCLRSWFQRQRTCPVCRADVLRAQAVPAPTPAPPAPPTTPPAADDAQAPRTLPPGFPPVALFPFWAPFSGAPPPGAATDAAQSHAEEEDEEEATGETLPPGFPPFSFPAAPWLLHMPPAPTPSPLVSSTPPPSPPPLSRQSEEEQEEARGRRLLCLQDIHSLLDAAMLNIHHYLSTLAPPPASPPSREAADRSSPTQSPPPAAQTPGQQNDSQTL